MGVKAMISMPKPKGKSDADFAKELLANKDVVSALEESAKESMCGTESNTCTVTVEDIAVAARRSRILNLVDKENSSFERNLQATGVDLQVTYKVENTSK